ncbi:RNA pseudouridine synthase 5 [Dorcoceras hygrometricum]|uniref:S-acyltransferase n=1 Tax=Dorcoceras hygrometricum TaxID=472368 RepID=A0A2Z7DCB1_9LAMI|nr:RNA pseudouridine synthase 5 [Dorcoceras hygrometricum]
MRWIGEPWPEFNDGIFYRDTVGQSDAGESIIEYYSRKYQNSAPLHGWLQRIHNKQITVDGCVVTEPDTVLRGGAGLEYHRLPWKEPDAPYLLEILYEDDDVVALNKPSGLQVLPGGLFQQRTALTQLQRHVATTSGCQKAHPVPVHRLGRGTSGVLLCAKTKVAKSCLAAFFAEGTSVLEICRKNDSQMRTRNITKQYRALVSGVIAADEVVIDQPIGLVKYPGVAKGLTQDVTSTFHCLAGDPLYCTDGQPKCVDHDIEVECFAQDGGYQRPEKPVPGDCGYHLHAHRVVFSHPVTKEVTEIIAPLPSILRTQEESKADVEWLGLWSSSGLLNAAVFTISAALCLFSFIFCVLTDPGGVPSGYAPDVEENQVPDQEIKKSDHHCVWINNCVGHRNYKSFVTLVFYSTLASTYSAVACGVITVGLSLILGSLLVWHISLIIHNLTTIEYHEGKRSAWLARKSGLTYRHPFDVGAYRNITLILGPSMLKWMWPAATSHIRDGSAFGPHEIMTARNAILSNKGFRSLRKPISINLKFGSNFNPIKGQGLALQSSSCDEGGSIAHSGAESLQLSANLEPISSESQFDGVVAEAQQLEESVVVLCKTNAPPKQPLSMNSHLSPFSSSGASHFSLKFKHGVARASSEDLPTELIEDSKFVPLNPEDEKYGPPIKQLLKELDGEFLKIIFCTEEMINLSLWQAVNVEQSNLEASKVAVSLPRICFLSGLTGEEMMMFIDAFPECGLEPPVFAALVPNSADKPVAELIEEIMGDHQMLVSSQLILFSKMCNTDSLSFIFHYLV